ncbi:MAG: adenylate/guanylate cyclase domain-containing protein [Holosporales bacterium]|jgi:adenylate cyclase|nr:adenylate/guanylate cyclase domain-containing protein [Holosporales bacterium]
MRLFPPRKLRVDILATFSLLIGVTVTCEIFYLSSANEKLVLEFEKDYYSKNITQVVANWMDEYFEKVEVMLKVLSKNLSAEQIDEMGKFDISCLEALKNIPYTQSFCLAFKDGTYFQIRNLDGITAFQTQKDKKLPPYAKYAVRSGQYGDSNNATTLNETWKYLNEDYGEVTAEYMPIAQYYPTKRDWYVSAELAKSMVWSDVYIFRTVKVPGITLSMPIWFEKNAPNTAAGVVAADITVSQFSNLLGTIKPSKNTVNYFINQKNEIIASSDNRKTFIMKNSGDAANFSTTFTSGDPILEEAAKQLIGENDNHIIFSFQNKNYIASIQKLRELPWMLLTISPEDDFTGEFKRVQREALFWSILVFLTSFGVIFIFSRRISIPITAVCKAAKSIGAMQLEEYKSPPPSSIIEIQELANAMDSMKLNVSTFTKYAPKDLVKKLIQQGIVPTLGGETKKITLMFSDIAKFSVISERLPAEYLTLHLSEYFDEITKEIAKYNGVIDKYIGDSVMAMWGAPNPDENQVVNACYAALACQELLLNLEKKWKPLGKPALPTRIGVHTGHAIVGNIGSRDRMNFTSIGDNVNIASRLEGANKYYGTKILVSEDVEAEARGKILFRTIDKIAVKGKSVGLLVYEPLCALKNGEDETYYEKIELSAKAKEAFGLYQNGEFKHAIDKYRKILELYPYTDKSVTVIINRCEEFINNLPSDWDGTFFLREK